MANLILIDQDGNGVPQFQTSAGVFKVLVGDKAPYAQLIDPLGVPNFTTTNPAYVKTTSSNFVKGAIQNVTTAGTRVALPNYPCTEVTIIAKKGNTGSIFAGGIDVSSTVYGIELESKESFTFTVSNTNMLYIDASVSGEGVSYIAI